jgi:uncharacterized membrane protein
MVASLTLDSGPTWLLDLENQAKWILAAAGLIIEFIGVGVVVLAVAVSTTVFLGRMLRREPAVKAYQSYRSTLGRGILLGLEFLVAGDIIRTVAVEPSLTNLGVLAGIVLIRTFLSFTLEVEVTGRWPWQHLSTEQTLSK